MVLITDEQNDSQILLPTATATVNNPVTVTSITISSAPTTGVSSYPSTITAATSTGLSVFQKHFPQPCEFYSGDN